MFVPEPVRLILVLSLCAGTAAFSVLFRDPERWVGLKQPSWAPHYRFIYVFGIGKYVIAGLAGVLAVRSNYGRNIQPATMMFMATFFLNVVAYFLIYELRAFAVTRFVTLTIFLTTMYVAYAWAERSALAAVLLLPYSLWFLYVSMFHHAIYRLNRA